MSERLFLVFDIRENLMFNHNSSTHLERQQTQLILPICGKISKVASCAPKEVRISLSCQ